MAFACGGLVGCQSSRGVTPKSHGISLAPVSKQEGTRLATQPLGFTFKDVTEKAGITFQHNDGAFGAVLLPETMGSGAIWFDFDSDGDSDIFFVNGRDWKPQEVEEYRKSPLNETEAKFLRGKPALPFPRQAKLPPYRRTTGELYRNNGNGTFTNVTKGSGLDVELMGMGASAADYNGDGRPDVCLTSYGKLLLFRNLGGGRFKDVSTEAGINDSAWSTSVAWLDYDRDGKLDLFVCRYAQWSPGAEVFRSIDGKYKSYGWPKDYKSQTCRLFRNLDGKRFRDVSKEAGISVNSQTHTPIVGAALGIVVCDLNRDNWPDLVVANDLRPNFLFLNARNGKFVEDGLRSGLATGVTGRPRGGMGIDTADIDRSDNDSVAIGHFNADVMGLWSGNGKGNYVDIAQQTEIGTVTPTLLTFGLLFFDVNNDGWPDLLAANGHVDPTVHNFLMLVHYEEPPSLFLNQTALTGGVGRPQFHDVAAQVGLGEPVVGRGLCVADYDLDGDMDVLMTTTAGRPRLLRNDGGNSKNSVRIVLRGKSSNLYGIGAHLKAVIGKETVRTQVRTGSSYLSQSEVPVTLGIGNATKIDRLSIRWPDNQKTEYENIPAKEILTISEAKGIVAHQPLHKSER